MRLIPLLVLATVILLPAPAAAPAEPASPPRVLVLRIDGAIGPVTDDYVHRGLARAEERHAALVVLQIDTPGGLDTAMRDIIKDILASPVPVATWVAPSGARAASAGTYILYASHVAAMAPATNLGAATPVAIGLGGESQKPAPAADQGKKGEPPVPADTMTRKQVQDAAAYVRSLAQFRHRNADWAEKAVREAVSLSADEALRQNVIDLIAADLPDLAARIDGRTVEMSPGTRTLATRGAIFEEVPQDWRDRLLGVITNPSVALMLMMAGVWGLFFEFSNPGLVFPGVAGALCLVLGLFAFQLLPINYAGLLLILLGIGFMIGEAFLPSFGSLGIGGVIAFVVGATIVIDTQAAGFGIPLPLIVGVGVGSALLLAAIGQLALRARRRPVVSGREELIGSRGEIVSWQDGAGWVRLRGEMWQARSPAALSPGQAVRVTGIDGLTLQVAAELSPQGE